MSAARRNITPPPQIAAIREAQALVATYKAHEARQDSADPLALVWSARQIAPLLTALAAALERVTAELDDLAAIATDGNEREKKLEDALERVTAERDEARAWRDLAEKSRAWFENALEAAEAERDEARNMLLISERAGMIQRRDEIIREAEAERDRLREALEATKGALGEWRDLGYVSAGGFGGDLGVRTASALNFADAVLAALASGTDAAPLECDGSRSCPAAVHVHGCFAEHRGVALPEQKP